MVKKWLKPYIVSDNFDSLEQHIQQLEKQTTAEVVTVIVRASSSYLQAQVTIVLTAAILFLAYWEVSSQAFHWDSSLFSLLWVVSGFLLLFFASFFLAKVPWIQRLMTVRAEEIEQCWKRAKIEFYENCVDQTQHRTGVLIFISILEKSVIVLADEKIAQVLPQNTWQETVNIISESMKKKDLAQGLKQAYEECSSLLVQHFPLTSEGKNELPNHIIIKE